MTDPPLSAAADPAVVERFRVTLMRRHADEWQMETVSNAAHLMAEVVAKTGRDEYAVCDEIDRVVSLFEHDSVRQQHEGRPVMVKYSNVSSLGHAQRLLRSQSEQARAKAEQADNAFDAAALRGKAVAFKEAADLLGVLVRKAREGVLAEGLVDAPHVRVHIGSDR